MPDVPPIPRALAERARAAVRGSPTALPEKMRACFLRDRPIEVRPVDAVDEFERRAAPRRTSVWFRAVGTLPDDPALHQCVLAYASDMTLLDTSTLPHAIVWCERARSRSRASTTRCGSTARSAPTTGCSTRRRARAPSGARGFNRGSVFTRAGELVASVAQEGLIRLRS